MPDRADGIKGSASPVQALARYLPFRIDESNQEIQGLAQDNGTRSLAVSKQK
jgi:hypothetical protein